MYINRAITACPYCNHHEEIWYYKSKITPTNIVKCGRCSYEFEADNFVIKMLNLRNNESVSSLEVARQI